MCGLIGYVDLDGALPDVAQLFAARERLARRGPDDAGAWSDGIAWLGHRRLAVLDLTAAGHQPMASRDGRHVIVFNGEVFNHLALRRELPDPDGGWRGSSDTETVLQAYRVRGEDCLRDFNGMFAIAIWDRVERRLFLARDRLGEKPLYVAARGRRIAFASRPGALRPLLSAAEQAFDLDALRAYLELGYVPAPLSLYQGIRKLPAGCAMTWDERGLRRFRWWDPRPETPPAAPRSDAELDEEFETLLDDAVRLRLLSDVPVGAFLSGGVDSALVVSTMRRVSAAAVRTYTIGFHEATVDESAAAAAIAGGLGTQHTMERLGSDDLLRLLPDCVAAFDEPVADGAAFSNLAVARLARREVTVALSGDAGDELFAGYHHYGILARLRRLDAVPPRLRGWLAQGLRVLPGHRTRLVGASLAFRQPDQLFHFLRSVGKDFPSFLDADTRASTRGSSELFEEYAAGFAPGLPDEEYGMRLDQGTLLPEGYLQKLDIATMAWSLEGRCPFTDVRLVEWALRLPLHQKLRGGIRKHLPKRVLARRIDPALVHAPKKGFVVPIGDWLRGPLRGWTRDLLDDSRLVGRLPIDRVAIERVLADHLAGRRQAQPVLWGVLMLLCFVLHHELGADLPDTAARRRAA